MLAARGWHSIANIALAVVLWEASPAVAQNLSIRFFDVGQGDAALVRSPEGKTVLIDAGPDEWTVAERLKQLHVDTLDLVIASHNHADHIRGLPLVFSSIPVRFYMDNGIPATTRIYQRVLEVVQERQIRYLEANPRSIKVGTATIQILPRPPGVRDQNNSSVGLLLEFHGTTTLFTGDAEYLERDYWRNHAHLPHVTILKVAHHGSVNGTDEAFVNALQPRFAVISDGAQNRYGHPSPETLRVLAAAGVQIYRTDRLGTIEVTLGSNGTVTFRTDRDVGPSPEIRIRASDQQLVDTTELEVPLTRIRTSDTAGVGAIAQCRDGTFSFSKHRRGTCSHHRGVARWLDRR